MTGADREGQGCSRRAEKGTDCSGEGRERGRGRGCAWRAGRPLEGSPVIRLRSRWAPRPAIKMLIGPGPPAAPRPGPAGRERGPGPAGEGPGPAPARTSRAAAGRRGGDRAPPRPSRATAPRATAPPRPRPGRRRGREKGGGARSSAPAPPKVTARPGSRRLLARPRGALGGATPATLPRGAHGQGGAQWRRRALVGDRGPRARPLCGSDPPAPCHWPPGLTSRGCGL